MVDARQSDDDSMNQKVWYDPKNPRMLSRREIAQLSPQECAAAIEQMDQNMVSLLEDIDDNFVKTTRIITDRLIPQVEQLGRSSKISWDSVKFWKTFFEAAAGVKTSAEPQEQEDDQTEATIIDNFQSTAVSEISNVDNTETGQQGREWADMPSMFHQLQQEQQPQDSPASLPWQNAQRPILDTTISDTSSVPITRPLLHGEVPTPQKPVTSRLCDLSIDSPDTTIVRPELEESRLHRLQHGQPSDKGKERLLEDMSLVTDESLPPSPSTSIIPPNSTSSSHAYAYGGRPLKNLISTPSRHKRPKDVPQGWNGLADLSKTPLSAFHSEARPLHRSQFAAPPLTNDESVFDDISVVRPPVGLQYSIARSAMSKTPAKVAAKQITRDILQNAALREGYDQNDDDDADIEPPSVIKNWATRGYGPPTSSYMPSSVDRSARVFTEEQLVDDDDEEESLQDIQPPKLEYQFILDPTAKIVDEDAQQPFSPHSSGSSDDSMGSDDGVSFNDRRQEDSIRRPQDEEDDWDDDSFASPGVRKHEKLFSPGATVPLAVPLRQQQPQAHRAPTQSHNPEEPTVFGARFARPSHLQREFEIVGMQGPNEMDTLHGGQLLESMPYVGSPLAGRDLKRGL